jgi:hypothetical protein
VPAGLEETTAILVHDVGMQTSQPSLARPRLGQVEQPRAEALTADVWVHARLVLEVGEVALATRAGVGENLRPAQRDPSPVLEARLVDTPPLAELLAGEGDRIRLAEVEAVAGAQQCGDTVGVVERRSTYEEVVQSGWPDSNRRLLAPKASTLTRLSYTPFLRPV